MVLQEAGVVWGHQKLRTMSVHFGSVEQGKQGQDQVGMQAGVELVDHQDLSTLQGLKDRRRQVEILPGSMRFMLVHQESARTDDLVFLIIQVVDRFRVGIRFHAIPGSLFDVTSSQLQRNILGERLLGQFLHDDILDSLVGFPDRCDYCIVRSLVLRHVQGTSFACKLLDAGDDAEFSLSNESSWAYEVSRHMFQDYGYSNGEGFPPPHCVRHADPYGRSIPASLRFIDECLDQCRIGVEEMIRWSDDVTAALTCFFEASADLLSCLLGSTS